MFKYYGPFRVLQRVSETSYKIQLPEGSTVHPVFHVSLLRQALKPGTQVFVSLPSETDVLAVPQKVLATRLRKKTNQVVTQNLIQWSNGDEASATWEDREELRARFPGAAAWGQAVSRGGGGVRVPLHRTHDQLQDPDDMMPGPTRPRRPNPRYYGSAWRN